MKAGMLVTEVRREAFMKKLSLNIVALLLFFTIVLVVFFKITNYHFFRDQGLL